MNVAPNQNNLNEILNLKSNNVRNKSKFRISSSSLLRNTNPPMDNASIKSNSKILSPNNLSNLRNLGMNPGGVSDTSIHLGWEAEKYSKSNPIQLHSMDNQNNNSNFNLLERDTSIERGFSVLSHNKPSEGDYPENKENSIYFDSTVKPKASKSDNNLNLENSPLEGEKVLWDEEGNKMDLGNFKVRESMSPVNSKRRSSFRVSDFNQGRRDSGFKHNKAIHHDASHEENTKEEKEKLKIRRQSKYTQIINQQNDPKAEEKLKNVLKEHINSHNLNEIKKDPRLSLLHYKENMKSHKILKFKKRSKSAKPEEDSFVNMGSKIPGDNKPVGLSIRIKTNFEKNKIKNLENPNNQEPFNENRFVRDKGAITQGMTRLREQIRNKIKLFNFIKYLEEENYYDKQKLTLNVFEDFEKQTSWQSYTTLLITDIDVINDKKEILGATRNLTGTKNFGSKTFNKK